MAVAKARATTPTTLTVTEAPTLKGQQRNIFNCTRETRRVWVKVDLRILMILLMIGVCEVNAMKCSKVWISLMMREDDGVCEFDVEVEANEVAKETK